jgi:hypothetical protein
VVRPVRPVVTLASGDSIQAAVNANPAGTVFMLAAGKYYNQTIFPKDGQQFIGAPGAVLDGSTVLSGWTYDNGYWQHKGLPSPLPQSGSAQPGHPNALAREDLFVGDKLYTRADSLQSLKSGSWYFNAATKTAYLKDNPQGSKVELSTTPGAFAPSGAHGVVIKGLTIEKYASKAGQDGAIAAGDGWQILDTVVRFNHGLGVQLGSNSVIQGGQVVDNGQLGIGVFYGNNAKVMGVEIARNNYAGFNTYWESGGIKMTNSGNVVVKGNYVHDNDGVGIWGDINMKNTLYAGNVVVGNTESGIMHEISYDATIRDNVSLRNGVHSGYDIMPAQIYLEASQNTKVYGNLVEVAPSYGHGISLIDSNRGSGTYGPYVLQNNSVHDNTIVHLANHGQSGMLEGDHDLIGLRNTWNSNDYVTPSGSYGLFNLDYASLNFSGLQQRGLEKNGTLSIEQRTALAVVPGTTQGDSLNGTTKNEVLVGLNGNDTLNGGGGKDVLSGGPGKDSFVMNKGYDNTSIIDFQITEDTIRLNGYGFANFAAVQKAMRQSGSDVDLNMGDGHHVLIKSTTVAQFTSANFSLVSSASVTGTATPASLDDHGSGDHSVYLYGTPANTALHTELHLLH